MVTLAENIYLWRTYRGLTQERLAKKAGIPRPNLAAIERGKREPSLSTLRALAACLGVDAGKLIEGIAPINFHNSALSRESQEAIARASVGKPALRLTTQQKIISSLLSAVIKNKINANQSKFTRSPLKNRRVYIKDWLLLKSALSPQLLHKLLGQTDKYI